MRPFVHCKAADTTSSKVRALPQKTENSAETRTVQLSCHINQYTLSQLSETSLETPEQMDGMQKALGIRQHLCSARSSPKICHHAPCPSNRSPYFVCCLPQFYTFKKGCK